MMDFTAYTRQEKERLIDYIAENFTDSRPRHYGCYKTPGGISYDLYLGLPCHTVPNYTLMTVGLGAAPQHGGRGYEHSEIGIVLPPSWQMGHSNGWQDEDGNDWPLRCMAQMAAQYDSGTMSTDTLIDKERPLGLNTGMTGCMVQPVGFDAQLAYETGEVLQSGDLLGFYTLVPIYPAEMELARKSGAKAVFDKIDQDLEVIQVVPLLPDRKNVCGTGNKVFAYPDDVDRGVSTEVARGYCTISDSIMVDGLPIDRLCRVVPADGYGQDSGWRALGPGDDLPQHVTVGGNNNGNAWSMFTTATIVAIDPATAAVLDAVPGSVFRHDAYGRYYLSEVLKGRERNSLSPAGAAALRRIVKDDRQDLRFSRGQTAGRLREELSKHISGPLSVDENNRRRKCSLDLVLWEACLYAFHNDRYDSNLFIMSELEGARDYAGGCGMWFYRYGMALTCMGRFKEALRYFELGCFHESMFAWNYLMKGRLLAHLDRREEALTAAEQGLFILPGNYEFEALKNDIEAGAALEQMMFHYATPEDDTRLHSAPQDSPEVKHFTRIFNAWHVDRPRLEKVKQMFHPMVEYNADNPYCSFYWTVGGVTFWVVIKMNEALLSHCDLEWLWSQREKIDNRSCLYREVGRQRAKAVLKVVVINEGYETEYEYKDMKNDRVSYYFSGNRLLRTFTE